MPPPPAMRAFEWFEKGKAISPTTSTLRNGGQSKNLLLLETGFLVDINSAAPRSL